MKRRIGDSFVTKPMVQFLRAFRIRGLPYTNVLTQVTLASTDGDVESVKCIAFVLKYKMIDGELEIDECAVKASKNRIRQLVMDKEEILWNMYKSQMQP